MYVDQIWERQKVCVFFDATYIPLSRDTVQREAVNIAFGRMVKIYYENSVAVLNA